MPQSADRQSTIRAIAYGSGLLLFVLLAGTVGYILIEGMEPLRAAYMTVIIISTVGLGGALELSSWGQVFTIFLIAVGVGAMLYLILSVIEFLIVEYLQEIRGRKRMNRQVAKLEDHFVVCGFGRVGESVADEMARKGVPFVVVERDEERCKKCAEKGYMYINGDATLAEVLSLAGVERAGGLVGAFPEDADNMYVTVAARELNPGIMIVVRSDREEAESKLRRVGADRVVFTHGLLGRRLANLLLKADVCDFLDISMGRERPEYDLTEMTINAGSPLAGRSIRDTKLRAKTGMTILAIKKKGVKDFNSNPGTDTMIEVGDKLILIGTPEQLEVMKDESALRD